MALWLYMMIKVYYSMIQCSIILGDPGATSRDDAIFSGESLLQELKNPWELILTELILQLLK